MVGGIKVSMRVLDRPYLSSFVQYLDSAHRQPFIIMETLHVEVIEESSRGLMFIGKDGNSKFPLGVW